MTFNGIHVMPDANNITVTTKLSYCDNTTLNLTKTIYNLRILYENNLTSNIFLNISLINFNCINGIDNYFEQIITFTQSISIRIQILFASIYYDYINANHYQFDGFRIDSETFFNLSSITVNNSEISNACSTGEAAQDLLCLPNSICTISSNPWNFTCSQRLITTTSSLVESTSLLETVMISSGLNSWKLGLICSFSILFVLLLTLFSGYFYRRYRHSKHLAISHVNLYDDVKIMQKTGIPQGQAFQRAATIVQPKRTNYTATSWIHDGTTMNVVQNSENYINIKPPGPYNLVTFVDHAKVYDPSFPSNIAQKSMTSINIPTSPSNKIESTIVSRPVSRTSLNQLRLITDGLQEDKLSESDNISINHSISNNPLKGDSPILRQYTNLSFIDDNLTDEDAWMSILDVVNDEIAKLNEQERIRTFL